MRTVYHCRGKLFPLIFFLLFLPLANANPTAAAPDYIRKTVQYTIPDVTLINQDGRKIQFREVIESDKPVILDFIYGTCTTICPVLSIGFSHFQKKLGPDAEDVRLISVTIDPDNDTPLVMKEYLDRYNAQPGWDFLTGNRDDIFAVMRAFDAFVTNKMDHRPLTFLHAPGSSKWIRINELLSSAELLNEYTLLKKQ